MRRLGIVAIVLLLSCKKAGVDDPTTTPPPPPPGGGAAAAPSDCQRVQDAITGWSKIRQLYLDFQATAKAKDWTTTQLNAAVTQAYNAGTSSGGGAGIDESIDVHTDCDCIPHGLDEICAGYAAKGLPSVLCESAKAHEAQHVKQCMEAKALADGDARKFGCGPDHKPSDSGYQRTIFEDECYSAQLAVLQQYAGEKCPSCKSLAEAKGWTSAINVVYLRTARTSYTEEKLQGDATYGSDLGAPLALASVSGYSSVWQGKAVGSGRFDAVETRSDGGEPFEGHGSGPLVDKVPIGRFTEEILRIDPKRCFYAFETSAVTASTWSDDVNEPDGPHVQLGDLPIPKGATSLSGTRTLNLPVSHFNWPGPAATLPHEPDSRGDIGGTITITWSFTPKR